MPRGAREKSKTGIYHIMLRGIDKRDIFLSRTDYEKFIEYIGKTKEKVEFQVYAYCLMTNHIHMLLKTEKQEIGDIVRRITVGYAQYHNIRNGRTGHLFQNRFKSEVVDNDGYFLTVLRYIHQNPLNAGVVESIRDYKWSSYNEYISKKEIIDHTYALSFFSSIEDFEIYTKEKNEDKCLEFNIGKRYSDEALKLLISSFINISELYELEIEHRDKMLRSVKESTGASNRQLARVLNIGRGIFDNLK